MIHDNVSLVSFFLVYYMLIFPQDFTSACKILSLDTNVKNINIHILSIH